MNRKIKNGVKYRNLRKRFKQDSSEEKKSEINLNPL